MAESNNEIFNLGTGSKTTFKQLILTLAKVMEKGKNLKIFFKDINDFVIGVDEVGRGSLIGPVYAAAVILKKSVDPKILKDSKVLSKKKREYLFNYIKKIRCFV